jgi:hypothetical protein
MTRRTRYRPDHAEVGADPSQYIIDVVDGIDPGVAFAPVWAVDRWVERD